jgi:hypothetical protein
VLDEDWVVEADRLAVHFEPDFGVGMFDAPNGVENIAVNDTHFLLPGKFCAPRWRWLEAVKPELEKKKNHSFKELQFTVLLLEIRGLAMILNFWP